MRGSLWILSALLLSSPIIISADISDPITVQDILNSNEQLDASLAETERGHLEQWRTRAETISEVRGEEANPEDDLAVLTAGIHIQIGDRKPADEFLNSLSDVRLADILQSVQTRRKRQPLDEAFARKKLATEIISRPNMEPLTLA